MFVHRLHTLLEDCGRSCFFDATSLIAEDVASCVKHAGATSVLVCILDDCFPSKWCLKEIEQAMRNGVTIITVYDMFRFTFNDVGKDEWMKKPDIPFEVTQAVFAKGAIPFNSHPDFFKQSMQLFEGRLMNLWQAQLALSLTNKYAEAEESEDSEEEDGFVWIVLPCTRQDWVEVDSENRSSGRGLR